ncbi:MAG TPA: hypothetical protein VN933_04815 [Candidatus Eremiobacteraceae bacterium]|jgi:hypothetical protein|nr:hypothetical protein [Candidatus Eremiobacteraceae bacterium]
MNKPTLQPEPLTAADNARVPTGEIIEIRNITLKAALKIVREQLDHDQSREHK